MREGLSHWLVANLFPTGINGIGEHDPFILPLKSAVQDLDLFGVLTELNTLVLLVFILMLISTPTEFKKIENRFLNKKVLASTIKKFEWKMGKVRLGNIFLNKPRPIENVDKISPLPVLFVHGQKDTIIEPWHSESLYKKSKEPKELVLFKDGLHAEDIFFGDNFDAFISLCTKWFKK